MRRQYRLSRKEDSGMEGRVVDIDVERRSVIEYGKELQCEVNEINL